MHPSIHPSFSQDLPEPHQVQQNPQSISGSVRVLQDLCQSLTNHRHGTVELHVAADQHVTCSTAGPLSMCSNRDASTDTVRKTASAEYSMTQHFLTLVSAMVHA